jgi:hypothetical protein
MSALLLRHPGKHQLLQDDLESHFYVLMYNALRYIPNDKMGNLTRYMERLFDNSETNADGSVTGGSGKVVYMMTEDSDVNWAGSPPLTHFVEDAKGYVREWFQYESSALARQLKAEKTITKAPDVPPHFAFANHDRLIELCQTTLERKEWPDADKVDDQLKTASSAGQTPSVSRKRGSLVVDDPSESCKSRKRSRVFPKQN